MKREFLRTGDGSLTIHLPEWNEQYHSRHGALAEARHVFIVSGLQHYLHQHTAENIAVLEIGFGTGLNAYLTALEAQSLKTLIQYTGVEAFPVEPDEIAHLNYHELLGLPPDLFLQLHRSAWQREEQINAYFSLIKRKQDFREITDANSFDLVYFDAFGPRVQPDLWTGEIFDAMYRALRTGGVLVTYSAKGSVRRSMIASGFKVERLPGPPGKREMLRATKTG